MTVASRCTDEVVAKLVPDTPPIKFPNNQLHLLHVARLIEAPAAARGQPLCGTRRSFQTGLKIGLRVHRLA